MNVVQFLHFVYTPKVSAPANSFLCRFTESGTLFKSPGRLAPHLPHRLYKNKIKALGLCLGLFLYLSYSIFSLFKALYIGFLKRVIPITLPNIPTKKNITAIPAPLPKPKNVPNALCSAEGVAIIGSNT